MIRITCINKDNGRHYNPHEAVIFYGWVEDGTNKSAKTDRQTVVGWVKNGVEAYVLDTFGNKAFCKPMISSNGTEFLQTYADKILTDNLLRLPECL